MEAVRTNGSTTKTSSCTRLNRPGLLLSKEIKPLKIVESRDEANQIIQDEEDPYKELELYLAKVNEEISELIKPVPPIRKPSSSGGSLDSGPRRTNGSLKRVRKFDTQARKKEDCWPDSFLDEFNSLIANEISELTKQAKQDTKPEDLYKGLLNELGISSSSDEERCGPKLNSDYDEPRDRLSLQSRKDSDYDEPANMLHNSSSSLPANGRPNGSPKSNVSTGSSNDIPLVAPSTDPMPRSTRMLFPKTPKNDGLPPFHDSRRKGSLPTGSLPAKKRTNHYGRIQKVKSEEPDYDEICEPHIYEVISRSRSLENNNCPRSEPSTPTEIKRSPFSKLLRKHKYAPVYKDNSADAILVRVSSLPDQDLVLTVGELGDDKRRGVIVSSKYDSLKKKRAVSPLSLSSDSSLTGKRLSELDKNVTQISPIEFRSFKGEGNDVGVGCDLPEAERSEVDGHFVHSAEVHVNGGVKTHADESSSSLPISLHTLLSRLTKNGSCCPSNPPLDGLTCTDMGTQTSPAISRSSSFTWVSDCDSPHHDARSLQDETILNPASPQNTVDDDNRSSSSSQDLLQSMDEISSGSLSPDATDRASPLESGIGTASPPRSTDRRITKPTTASSTTLPSPGSDIKETWDRIRRPAALSSSRSCTPYAVLHPPNDTVWIKRESVHTQTGPAECSQEAVDSSSGLDDSLPRTRAARPLDLPLGLSTTTSSSLSSGELLVHAAAPRALSSPSTASLQLRSSEPMTTIEFGGKSCSAPRLDNNVIVADKTVVEEPNRQQPRSQSERQLSARNRTHCGAPLPWLRGDCQGGVQEAGHTRRIAEGHYSIDWLFDIKEL